MAFPCEKFYFLFFLLAGSRTDGDRLPFASLAHINDVEVHL